MYEIFINDYIFVYMKYSNVHYTNNDRDETEETYIFISSLYG